MRIETMTGGGYTAAINLSRGGNCFSLRNQELGVSLLREPDYSRELDNPYLYGNPILFPVNWISGGCFSFDGRQYMLPVNEKKLAVRSMENSMLQNLNWKNGRLTA